MSSNDGPRALCDPVLTRDIVSLAEKKLPIFVPWHPAHTVSPGTCFQSARCLTDDPWSKESPFLPESLAKTAIVYRNNDGGSGSFKSTALSSSSSSSDHLSTSLAVTVGCVFVSVSVTAQYDRKVLENADSDKTSIRSTYRCGALTLDSIPRLSNDALATIKYDGGLDAFYSRYGDYYVAGYRIGGEAGMMLSSSSWSKKTDENFSLTVKVDTIFGDFGFGFNSHWESFAANRSLSIAAYDTLSNEIVHLSTDKTQTEHDSNPQEVFEVAARLKGMLENLGMRVEQKLGELQVQANDHLDFSLCERVTRAGMVADLILLPMHSLREIVEWHASDDII